MIPRNETAAILVKAFTQVARRIVNESVKLMFFDCVLKVKTRKPLVIDARDSPFPKSEATFSWAADEAAHH
jgi:hypothetical protein